MPDVETDKRGIILFLKAVQEIDTRLLNSYNIETGALHHPVVVLHDVENTDDVIVCLVSDLCYISKFNF